MSTLSKHVIVMEFQNNDGGFAYFTVVDEDGELVETHEMRYGFAYFTVVDEDGELIETHEMRSQLWHDMGEPSQITVTIEPGDKLNEDVQFDKDGNIVGTSG